MKPGNGHSADAPCDPLCDVCARLITAQREQRNIDEAVQQERARCLLVVNKVRARARVTPAHPGAFSFLAEIADRIRTPRPPVSEDTEKAAGLVEQWARSVETPPPAGWLDEGHCLEATSRAALLRNIAAAIRVDAPAEAKDNPEISTP